MAKTKVQATYKVGNSDAFKATVEVTSVAKGVVEEAIAGQLGMDVRHVNAERIQVIK